uniref:Multiple epidermal growth factor-like domains 10 n=1 Tax=Magallana gigas TaxID=29159 RepID=K1R1W2_MAGGI
MFDGYDLHYRRNIAGCNETDMYGSNCDILCPTNCKYNTCHIEQGTCFGCQPGWTGLYCNTVCDDGTYGYNCVNNCSGHCLNGSHCNKHTGYCDEGCSPGYTDSDCSRACQSGYFGINCTLPCLPNCKTCRHTDGLCSCRAGWMGHNCSIECIQSYGENCQYPCSGQCINQTCDRFNGNCLCDGKCEIQSYFSSTNVMHKLSELRSYIFLAIKRPHGKKPKVNFMSIVHSNIKKIN